MKEIPEVNIFVRFCETDAAGHVSNVSYYMYFEEARTKFFDLLSIGTQKEKGDLSFIIASTKCDYVNQAFAKQTLIVSTKVAKIGIKSFTMEHEIKCAKTGSLIAVGNAVIVCFDFVEQQTREIPPELRRDLEQYLVSV